MELRPMMLTLSDDEGGLGRMRAVPLNEAMSQLCPRPGRPHVFEMRSTSSSAKAAPEESHDAELYEQMFDERTWEMYERILRRRVASPATSAVSSARTALSSGSSVMSEYVELSSRPSSVPREATAAGRERGHGPGLAVERPEQQGELRPDQAQQDLVVEVRQRDMRGVRDGRDRAAK